jgi:thiol-disulfide isomerase/thioredoxin
MPETTPSEPTAKPTAKWRIPLVIGAVLAGAVIGYVGVSGLRHPAGGDVACNSAVDLAKKIAPLAHGEVAALTMATTPLRLPDLTFEDANGQPKKLSDWRGKTVLVNLWATWCVPCIKELPTLDALAAREAGKLQVVVVNEDLEGARVVAPFLQKRPLKTLKPWMDTNNALMIPLKASSLPTTVLYSADGKQVWRIARDMDWSGPEAAALIAQAGG